MSTELELELEVLKSSYIKELEYREDNGKIVSICVNLEPATGDVEEAKFVRLTMVIDIPNKYPNVLPSVTFNNSRGLSDEAITRIENDCKSKAEASKGNPMLFELIEVAKEMLTFWNIPNCQCAICLQGFSHDDVFTKTECYHYFHSYCLSSFLTHSELIWNEKNKEETMRNNHENPVAKFQGICPICRLSISFEINSYPPPNDSSSENFEISQETKVIQEELAILYAKQKASGGIIDLQEEKSKFEIEISNVPTINTNKLVTTLSSKAAELPKEIGETYFVKQQWLTKRSLRNHKATKEFIKIHPDPSEKLETVKDDKIETISIETAVSSTAENLAVSSTAENNAVSSTAATNSDKTSPNQSNDLKSDKPTEKTLKPRPRKYRGQNERNFNCEHPKDNYKYQTTKDKRDFNYNKRSTRNFSKGNDVYSNNFDQNVKPEQLDALKKPPQDSADTTCDLPQREERFNSKNRYEDSATNNDQKPIYRQRKPYRSYNSSRNYNDSASQYPPRQRNYNKDYKEKQQLVLPKDEKSLQSNVEIDTESNTPNESEIVVPDATTCDTKPETKPMKNEARKLLPQEGKETYMKSDQTSRNPRYKKYNNYNYQQSDYYNESTYRKPRRSYAQQDQPESANSTRLPNERVNKTKDMSYRNRRASDYFKDEQNKSQDHNQARFVKQTKSSSVFKGHVEKDEKISSNLKANRPKLEGEIGTTSVSPKIRQIQKHFHPPGIAVTKPPLAVQLSLNQDT